MIWVTVPSGASDHAPLLRPLDTVLPDQTDRLSSPGHILFVFTSLFVLGAYGEANYFWGLQCQTQGSSEG